MKREKKNEKTGRSLWERKKSSQIQENVPIRFKAALLAVQNK